MINDYQTIKKQADQYRTAKQFGEALPLYEHLWRSRTDGLDKDAGWGYAYCLRSLGRPSEALEICRLIHQVDPEFEFNNNTYGWCLYDLHIKKSSQQGNQKAFLDAANEIIEITSQAKFSPYVRTVFEVVTFLKGKEPVPYPAIIDWLNLLDVMALTFEATTGTDGKRMSSDREKWYLNVSKALLELRRYEQCIEVCTRGLNDLVSIPDADDFYLRYRRATSNIALNRLKESLDDLKFCMERKPDYWIRHQYAIALDRLGQANDAITILCNIAKPSNRLEYRWEVFFDLGVLLEKQGETVRAKQHFQLAAAIYVNKGWKKDLPRLKVALQRFGLSTDNLPDAKRLHGELMPFWKKLSRPQTSHTGTILRIHQNGKSGHIRADDGSVYFFGMKSVDSDVQVADGMKVGFNLHEQTNSKSGQSEMHAVDIVGRS